jgi:hypothetical protein
LYCIVLHQFCINYCFNFNWFWSFFIWNNWGCLPLKKVEFVFHFQKYWGHLTFSKEMRPYFIKQIRLSSIFIKIEVVFHLRTKIEVVFHFYSYCHNPTNKTKQNNLVGVVLLSVKNPPHHRHHHENNHILSHFQAT